MPVKFRKQIIPVRLLDASQGFQEVTQGLEFRFDPLLGRPAAITDTAYRRYKLPPPDIGDLVKRSIEAGCPFCPGNLEKVTPRFPPEVLPEGRLTFEEICVFPNNAAFAPYSAVAALGKQHFIPVGEYPQELLVHGLQACQLFFQRVSQQDPRVRYGTINWNCFPPAGGSIIHPHFQPIADYFPVYRLRQMLESPRRYQRRHGSPYWADLVAQEKALGARHIADTGRVTWLASFAPWSRWWDVMALFPSPTPVLQFSVQDWQDFVSGLRQVMKYISDQNFYSFNMTLFFTVKEAGYFWPHAHIMPRIPLPPMGMSDASYIELCHDQITTARPPEEVCQELRGYFEG